jgi:putative phosphoesterase
MRGLTAQLLCYIIIERVPDKQSILNKLIKESDLLRIVVVSDTHGKTARLEEVILQQAKADYFIHLGDCVGDVEEAKFDFPGKMFLNVPGNCDFASPLPVEDEFVVCGKRIFYTHGHKYYVKSGYSRIIHEAVTRHADILLFGHTHAAYTAYENGLYIMNPGSLSHPHTGMPTYGVIDITPAGIVTNIVEA